MEEKDFSKLWGSNGSVATMTDDQYRQGWVYIGDNKPTRAQFNAWQQWSDRKHYWLFMNKLGIDDTAKSAKKLETSRTIKVSGAVKGEAKFDGTSNIEIKVEQQGFEASLAPTGWHKDSTGLITQWGMVKVSAETQVNFHKTLSALYNVQVSSVLDVRPGSTRTVNVHVMNASKTGFIVSKSDNYSSGEISVYWEAKGK